MTFAKRSRLPRPWKQLTEMLMHLQEGKGVVHKTSGGPEQKDQEERQSKLLQVRARHKVFVDTRTPYVMHVRREAT